MEFTEFAQKLKPIIGGSYNTPVFVKTLFESIITEEGLLHLEDISINTFKAYYNGQTKITKIAQRILPHIEPEQFITYLDNFPDATTQRLCDTFKSNIEDVNLNNTSKKIAYFFEEILILAASQKRKGCNKKVKKIEGSTPSENIDSKFSTTTLSQVDAGESKTENLTNEVGNNTSIKDAQIQKLIVNNLCMEDTALLKKFRTEAKPILKYCIDHDPSGEGTKLLLSDEISQFTRYWQFEYREIEDTALRRIIEDTIKVLNDYTYYISDKFLRLLPDRNFLWVRNESLEEGQQLRDVFRPETIRLRTEMSNLYLRLYPLPEDDTKIENNTTIQEQTNVVQYGNTNVNMTNNGTLTIKL